MVVSGGMAEREMVWHETCGVHQRDPSCERAGCTEWVEPEEVEDPTEMPPVASRNGKNGPPVPEAAVDATPMTEMQRMLAAMEKLAAGQPTKKKGFFRR